MRVPVALVMQASLAAIVLGVAPSRSEAQASPAPAAREYPYLPRVEVAAGGGFLGRLVSSVGQRAAIVCDTTGTCAADSTRVTLYDATTRKYAPALSAGIVFRWRLHYIKADTMPDKRFGLGVGAHLVFSPEDGGTSVIPAATVHAGTQATQVFFGIAFSDRARVAFPGHVRTLTVPTGTNVDFIKPTGGHRSAFFLGVVIDGVAITRNAPQ